MLQQCRERRNFLNRILFTDEAAFTQCCIVNDRLVGPFVLLIRLNAAQYLEFLNNVLKEQLEVEVLLSKRVHMWYLLDEAPPHFAGPVTEWLKKHFPNHWVGRNCPVAWPSRSPDLSPCNFCLWGWMKQLVYGNQHCPETFEELQQRVEVVGVTVRETAKGFLSIRVVTC